MSTIPSPRSTPRLTGRTAILALVLALCSFAAPAVATDHPDPWPGLPYIPYIPGRVSGATPDNPLTEWLWAGAPQVGIAGSSRSMQWARVPLTILAANAGIRYSSDDPTIPANWFRLNYLAFMVSPSGSAHNYGDSPLISVRTVAFGAVPVEATLQLHQERDKRDMPVPIGLTSVMGKELLPVDSHTAVTLSVNDLKVDGVDLRLPSCSAGAELDLTSEHVTGAAASDDRTSGKFDPAHGFIGLLGGTLFGTLDVASFRDCRTKSGENIGPLLTATISGPANPVRVQVGAAKCWQIAPDYLSFLPPAPGQTTPEKAHCFDSPILDDAIPGANHPYPSLPKVVIVPDPLLFPTQAP